jgi:hypothetical protein
MDCSFNGLKLQEKTSVMPVTFVSALLDLNQTRRKSVERYFTLFEKIVRSGVQIHLYLSKVYRDEYADRLALWPNVYVEILEMDDLDTKTELDAISYGLPHYRAASQDTENFLILMAAKAELVWRACSANVYNTSHFAWIDFGTFHMIKKDDVSIALLQRIAAAPLAPTCFHIPGCWNKGFHIDELQVFVNWRFCGTFFVADRESILHFYRLHQENLVQFTLDTKILVWEVNFWAYLEFSKGWRPQWYLSDHTDLILQMPPKLLNA